jgi:PAS domain S-box-containing protein
MEQVMGKDPNDRRDARAGVCRLRPSRLAWVPIPVLLTALGVFWAADWQGSHESIYLLLTLNLVFSLLVCLVVAYLVMRSFLVRGAPGLLLLSCGVVLWGPAGVVATAAARGDANLSITIYNSCVWLSGLCHLAGVSLALRSRRSLSPPALWLLSGCVCAVGAMALVVLLALAGWMPAFLIEEQGGTPVRQVVLISAIVMFALTAALLGATGRRTWAGNREGSRPGAPPNATGRVWEPGRPMSAFAYWYALALLLIAVGLLGVALQTSHASILGWTGRATQALGGLYMLIAAVASVRESRVWEISLEAALREERDFNAAVLETAGALVVVLDAQGRITRFNRACERLTGYSAPDVLGRTFWEFLIPPDERAEVRETWQAIHAGNVPSRNEHHWLTRDGTRRLIDWSNTTLTTGAGQVGHVVAIGIDITERKQAQESLRDANENLRAQAERLRTFNDMLQAKQQEVEAANEDLRVQEEELREQAEALRESEQRYRTLFETAPDAIVVHRDGRLLAANDALLRLAGAGSFQELAARGVLDFFPPGDREQAAERVRLAQAGRRQPIRESTLLRLNGQEVVVELHTGPIDFQGAPAVQTILRDITERRRAEEALKESESHLAQAQQIAHLGSWSWDLARGRLYWSDEIYRLYGLQPGEVVPRHEDFLGFVHPEDRPRVEKGVQEALAHGGLHHLDFRIVRKGGDERYVHCEAQTILDAQGRPTKAEGALQDITERKRVEEALRESEARYRMVGETIPYGVWLTDARGYCTYVSDSFLELVGLTMEQVQRFGWLHLLPPEDVEPTKEHWLRCVARGENFEREHRFRTPEGSYRDVLAIGRPLRNERGQTTGWAGINLDITGRKRAEEELRRVLQDTQRRCAEISALMTCTRAIAECRDLLSTTRTVFDACRELLGAPAGYVALLTPDGENNDVLFLEAGGLCCTVDPSLPMPVRGLRGEVYRTGQVMYENDFARSRWAKLLPPGHVRLENVLFAPLVMDGRVVGLLGLGNKRGGFTDQDAALAATFGELVAIALRNSRTLDSLRELNTTLESKVAQRTAELERRTRQLQKLTLELSEAEERERRRVAVVLHEDLQQQIAGAKFHLGLLNGRGQHESRQDVVQRIDEMLKEAMEKSRRLSYDLSPAVLHMNDLAEVLLWLAKQVWARHGLTVHVEVRGEAILQSESLTIFLFRAAQEVLSNVVKHAQINEATIRLRRMGQHVRLCISDTGRGFDPEGLKDSNGFGLLGIRERVELLGGRMKIRSFRDRGTAVRIVVPEAPETAAAL